MPLIEYARVVPRLPKMPFHSVLSIEPLTVIRMSIPEGFSERRFDLGHNNEMDVVGHERVVPNQHAMGVGLIPKGLLIVEAILVVEKDVHPAISALRHVMCTIRHNNSSSSRHVDLSEPHEGGLVSCEQKGNRTLPR